MWSRLHTVAVFLLASGLGSCGGATRAEHQTPLVPAPATATPSQDQQILLDPVVVASLDTRGASHVARSESSEDQLHQPEELAHVVLVGGQDALACHQKVGAKLRGEVVVSLELDASGQVLGGATSPPGGEEALAALADCLLVQARTWTFPSRSLPGRTVLVVSYLFGEE